MGVLWSQSARRFGSFAPKAAQVPFPVFLCKWGDAEVVLLLHLNLRSRTRCGTSSGSLARYLLGSVFMMVVVGQLFAST